MNNLNLKRIREIKNMSAYDVAYLVGEIKKDHSKESALRRNIMRIENGEAVFTPELANDLASALQVSNRFFFRSPSIVGSEDVSMYLSEVVKYCSEVVPYFKYELDKDGNVVLSFGLEIMNFLGDVKDFMGKNRNKLSSLLQATSDISRNPTARYGARIRLIMDYKNISFNQLAEDMGVSYDSLYDMLAPEHAMPNPKVKFFARHLDVSASSITDNYFVEGMDDIKQFFIQCIISGIDFTLDKENRLTFTDRIIPRRVPLLKKELDL